MIIILNLHDHHQTTNVAPYYSWVSEMTLKAYYYSQVSEMTQGKIHKLTPPLGSKQHLVLDSNTTPDTLTSTPDIPLKRPLTLFHGLTFQGKDP